MMLIPKIHWMMLIPSSDRTSGGPQVPDAVVHHHCSPALLPPSA
jgi:hypothetical protein